jgi:predicted lipoprotein with Yx(FWY)xxD motif
MTRIMSKTALRATLLAAAMCAAPQLIATAAAQAVPAKTANTSKGQAFVDAKGMTLYTYDKDTTAGKSACNGPCATNWPPLHATSGTGSGDWSVVTRDDGTKQWAYKGKPLYTWAKDSKPGDATGDGMASNSWHIAKPQ